jgi:hypothetical protein
LDIGQIGGGMPVQRHEGMMNTAAHFLSGRLSEKALVGGQLAFITATVNNQSVMVDFASFARDTSDNPILLGNVSGSPQYAETAVVAIEKWDGTIAIAYSSIGYTDGMGHSVLGVDHALYEAHLQYNYGLNAKPLPTRCYGALFYNDYDGRPIEPGKCDDGVMFGQALGGGQWAAYGGNVFPYNSYMRAEIPGPENQSTIWYPPYNAYVRVISATYVHFNDPPFSRASTTAQVLPDPGFESGTGWSATPSTVIGSHSTSDPARFGMKRVKLGGLGVANSGSVTSAPFTIPAAATKVSLQFYLRTDTSETTTTAANDTLAVRVLSSAGTVLGTLGAKSNLNALGGYGGYYRWHYFLLDAFKGQTIKLQFQAVENGSLQTRFLLDDIKVDALGVTFPTTPATTTTATASAPWTYFGRPGYSLQTGTTLRVHGDNFSAPYTHAGGMERAVQVGSSGVLSVSLTWRALSGYSGSTVTNGYLQLVDAQTGASLYQENLIAGGTTDTGWRAYQRNLSPYLGASRSVKLRLWLTDAWSTNWRQELQVTNVQLTTY